MAAEERTVAVSANSARSTGRLASMGSEGSRRWWALATVSLATLRGYLDSNVTDSTLPRPAKYGTCGRHQPSSEAPPRLHGGAGGRRRLIMSSHSTTITRSPRPKVGQPGGVVIPAPGSARLARLGCRHLASPSARPLAARATSSRRRAIGRTRYPTPGIAAEVLPTVRPPRSSRRRR